MHSIEAAPEWQAPTFVAACQAALEESIQRRLAPAAAGDRALGLLTSKCSDVRSPAQIGALGGFGPQ